MSYASQKPPSKLPKHLRESLNLCFHRPDRVLFLDIETTGLSHYYDEITVVGWSLDGHSKSYVKGDPESHLHGAFDDADVMITFNGIRFDARFIRNEFPEVALPLHHIDLMYLARRVGLTGGQKAIEQELGISIREAVDGIDGFAAVLLWHQYLRGDLEALEKLLLYNRADIAAMGSIFDHVLQRLDQERDLFNQDVLFSKWAGPRDWNRIDRSLVDTHRDLTNRHTFNKIFSDSPAENARVVGIDLTGSEARATGWSLLEGTIATTELVRTDAEIVARTIDAKPDLVSIDSPLCLPHGRTSVFDDDPKRDEIGIMRECERELKRRGVNVYPCLLPSMQRLTARGIKIAETLREQGIPVIESYPGAAQDIMRIPRKGAGVQWLQQGLEEFGLRGEFTSTSVSHDELDAVTSALVGTFHLAGLVEELGTENEPPLIIPDLNSQSLPIVVGISGPIAAGKTTLAKLLETKGFAYTRFSLVIDNILKERGLELTRSNRQEVGIELNQTGRQRELATRTLKRVDGHKMIVVDGLRFAADHSYFVERFGLNFIHIFVDADGETREQRFVQRNGTEDAADHAAFRTATRSDVEREVTMLRESAHCCITNEGSKEESERAMLSAIEQHFGKQLCLSQS